MKKILLYSFAACISFILYLLISAPAAPLWSFFGKDLENNIPELQISSIQGKVWHGQANLNYRTFPTSLLIWDLKPLALFQNTIDSDLEINGDFHKFKTHLNANQNNIQIQDLSGHLDANYINQLSESLGLTFTGTIDVQDINIEGNSNSLSKADGHIRWNGGQITSRAVATGTQVFDLPPLRGDFSINKSNHGLQLNIFDDEQILIEITLKLNGWAVVKIKVGLFQLAGLSWQGESDDNAIEIEEKVL